ncbi:hypothetical protein EDB85DRAFT_211263 [Lactarius pseudohatsudake]|nr:hypothetical protein EDB85DRAFT_211263 [Lactarius pseudohatsudake]
MTTYLKSLRIHFLPFASSAFRDTGSAGPLRAYAVFPSLSEFCFAVTAHLEDFISRIGAPVWRGSTFFKPSALDAGTKHSRHLIYSMSTRLLGDDIWSSTNSSSRLSQPVISAPSHKSRPTSLDLQVTLLHILTLTQPFFSFLACGGSVVGPARPDEMGSTRIRRSGWAFSPFERDKARGHRYVSSGCWGPRSVVGAGRPLENVRRPDPSRSSPMPTLRSPPNCALRVLIPNESADNLSMTSVGVVG